MFYHDDSNENSILTIPIEPLIKDYNKHTEESSYFFCFRWSWCRCC